MWVVDCGSLEDGRASNFDSVVCERGLCLVPVKGDKGTMIEASSSRSK